jgi:aspartyl/asparaginyl beta-hydroxylase (cupin superfamily)
MGEVMEPREPGYSIFKGAKPEPKIVYELPDGTTTIWLSEYIEAMVQAEQDRIVKLLEVWWETDQELEELIALIKGENK